MRREQEEQRVGSPNMAAAATAYQDNYVHTGHMDQNFGAPSSLLFGDTSFLNFENSNPDQALSQDHHNPQAILNTSDYDFLNNFFTNPDSLNQIQLNPYDFAPDDKSSSSVFAASAFNPYGTTNDTINPSTLAPSQASLHKTHTDPNHMPFASQSGAMAAPQQQQRQSHDDLSAADYTAASTIHNLKATPAPHLPSPSSININFAGASSWGSFIMPSPQSSSMDTGPMNSQPRGNGHTRHPSFSHGLDARYFQGVPSHVPTAQHQQGFPAESASQYQHSLQRQHLQWNGSQSMPSGLPHGHTRPPTVSFGSDPSFVSTHFHSPTPTEHHDKEGNLVNIPYAAQAAQAGMRRQHSQSTVPGIAVQQNGGHMQSRRPASARDDTEPARKRRKSQADHEDEDEYMPADSRDAYRPTHADDSGDEIAADAKHVSKRRKSTATRPAQPAMSPTALDDESTKRGIKKSRETLTEHQKRQHHINSEKKRREIINQGYNDLNVLVPCLNGGKSGLSRSECLQESASYIEALLSGSLEIMQQLGLTEADLVAAPHAPVKVESDASGYGP